MRGRVLWHVNGLGTVLSWLEWPRGFVMLVLLPAALLVVAEAIARRGGGAARGHPAEPGARAAAGPP